MVERGIADADAGRLIPHETVAEEMRRKWQVGREAIARGEKAICEAEL